MAEFAFDTASVPASERSFELLPAGWYPAQVVESDVAPLKSGNGTAVKVTFEVLADGLRGRKLWTQFNTRHTNPEAERIGLQQLRELCEAVGLRGIKDTTDLHKRPVLVKVSIKTDAQYGDKNEIKGYKAAAAGAAPTSFARPASPPAANAPTAGAATPPWQKRA